MRFDDVRSLFLADAERYLYYTNRRYSRRSLAVILATQPGILATALYRFGHWAQQQGGLKGRWCRTLHDLARRPIEILTGISIAPTAHIGPGLYIGHFGGVIVGASCVIGTKCNLGPDTLISSGIAIVLTLALGLGVSYRLTHGKPGKLQSVLELLLSYIRNLTKQMVSDEGTDFIIPIAATIFIFVLFANYLDFFPLTAPVEPAAADINLTLAMAIAVIVIVQWYSIHVLGFRGYLRRFTKPFELPLLARIAFTPLNIIEEIQKPLSLGLRLFGNIFGGLVMVYLLTLGFTAFAGSSVIQTALSPIWILLLVAW